MIVIGLAHRAGGQDLDPAAVDVCDGDGVLHLGDGGQVARVPDLALHPELVHDLRHPGTCSVLPLGCGVTVVIIYQS